MLQGAAQANFTWTVFAAIGVILSACYMLWMYQRVFYGDTPMKCVHSAGPERARVGVRGAADRDDGLDGNVSRSLSCRRSARPTRGYWIRAK